MGFQTSIQVQKTHISRTRNSWNHCINSVKFKGDVSNDRELLKWVKRQFEGDDIEEVNAKILDKITRGEVGNKEIYGEHNDAAVLFCEKKNISAELTY